MSPPRRSMAGASRRGSTGYFFFFFRRAFFFFGAFFAAPFEAAALARFRLAFICSNPLCRRNAFDSMKVATESRMELRISGVELRIFVTEGCKTESKAVCAVSSLRIFRRIGRADRCARGLLARHGVCESDAMPR
jgi:hypothetical protein